MAIDSQPLSSATQALLSGSDIKWVETILGAVPPNARTGELATKNQSQLAASLVIAQGCVSPGDGGGGPFYWSTGTAADNGGTIIVPTSGGGHWRRIFDGPLSVKWFGAQGGGATNDSIAIQNAINVASNAEGGQVVLLPPGTYNADNLIINGSYVTLQGSGKSSVLAKNSTGNALITFGATTNVTIRDLKMRMVGTPNGWGIFCASNAIFATIDNIYMEGMAYGIGLEPTAPNTEVHNTIIRGCHLLNIKNQGVALFNAIDTFISDTGIYIDGYTPGSVGIQFDTGSDGLYTSNVIVTQGNPAPIVIQNSLGGRPPRHGFFSRTAADGGESTCSSGCPQAAWIVWNGHRMHFVECWAATQHPNASGVLITYPSYGLEFENCIVLNNSIDGYRIGGGPGQLVKHVGIIGGQVVGNGNLSGSGIYTAYIAGLRIVGVRSGNDPDFTIEKGRNQVYGVYLDRGLSYVSITGCDLTENNTKSLFNPFGIPIHGMGTNLIDKP